MIQLHHYQETSCMHKITWSRVPRQNSRFSPFFGSLQTFQGHTEKNHKLQMLKYRHHFQGNESLVQTSREQNPVRYNALTRSTACWHVSYVERETKHTPWVMKVINTLRKEELDFPSLEVFKGRQDAFGGCASAKEKLWGSKQKRAGQHLLASDRWGAPNLMCFQLPVPWISKWKSMKSFTQEV